MARVKTTTNTFVVTTVEDGASVPSYIQSQEAWSNRATTSSQSTMPSDCSENDWMDYTPPQNGKTYLWRRSRTMTLDNVTMTYIAGPTWTYARLSGTNGTSITINGSIQTAIGKNDHLPQTATEGDTIAWLGADGIDYYYRYHNGQWEEVLVGNSEFYTIEKDSIVDGVNRKGHLVGYNYEADKWLDYGVFQGENGLTYYTHVAWAEDVTLSQSAITPPSGQTTTPNATAVSGFSISPGEGKDWMGVMIDQTVTDSQTGTLYTWSYTKGNPAETYSVELDKNCVIVPSSPGATTLVTLTGRFVKHVAGEGVTAIGGKWGKICFRLRNGQRSATNAVQVSVSGLSVPNIEVTSNVEALEVYMLESQVSGAPSTWLAKAEVAIIPEGLDGEDGQPGSPGQNSVRLDLDNEMDSIQYVGTEKLNNNSSVRTGVTLYDGANRVALSGIQSWNYTLTDCTGDWATSNPDQYSRSFIVTAIASGKEKGLVTITAQYAGKTYSAVFTVMKLSNAAKYQLDISKSAVAYNPDQGDASATSISVKIWEFNATTGLPNLISSLGDKVLSITGVPSSGNSRTITPSHSGNTWTFSTNNTTDKDIVVELWNNSQKTVLYDRETIPIAKVEDGADGASGSDAVVIDLTNEMDAVPMSEEGRVIASQSIEVQTGVNMFLGSIQKPLSSITWTGYTPPSGVSIALVPASGTPTGIKVTITNGTTLTNDKLVIPLTATATINGASVSKNADFTIQGVRSGSDAVIYQLNPSDTTIKKTQSGTKIPSQITCSVLKRSGNNAPVAVSDNTVKVFYQINSSGAWTAYTVSSNVSTSTVTDFIRFRLYQGIATVSNGVITGGTLIDVETVPLVEAGVDGSSPLVIDLSNQMDSIPMTMEGGVIGDGTSQNKAHASTTISLYYGATRQTITGMATSYSHTGVDVDFPKVSGSNNYTGAINVTIDDGTTFANDKAVITVQATCANGSRSIDFIIQGVRAGGVGLSPTIYSIGVSHDEIKVNSSGTRLPQTMKVYRKSTIGDTTEPTTNGAVFYSVDGGNEVQFLWGTGTEATINQNILNSVTNNITFRYYDTNSKTTLLDTETVPVVYDGEDGDSPYWIDLQTADAYVDQNGTPHINLSWFVRKGEGDLVPFVDGQNGCEIKLSSQSGYTDAGVTAATSLYDDDGIADSFTNDTSVLIIYEEGTGQNAVVMASLSVPIVRYGERGSDATDYKIYTQKQNIIIAENQTEVQYVDQATFKKKEGATESNYALGYGAFYTRTGSTYARIYPTGSSWAAGATLTITAQQNIKISKTVDEVLVYLASSISNLPASAMPTNYLAVKGLPVQKKGDTGAKGDDAVTYEIDVISSEASIESNRLMHGNVYWKVYRVSGSTRTEVSTSSVTGSVHRWKLNNDSWNSQPSVSGGNLWTNNYYNNKRYDDDLRLQEIPASVEIQYLIGVDGVSVPVASKSVPFSIQGQMGRNFYYDGDWSASRTYTTTDYSAPFVSYQSGGTTGYYVMKGDNRDIRGNDHSPGNNSNDWEIMTSQFKYLITEAVFTEFAKLGASVFNGDYMFSQHGYVTGFDGARQKIEDGSMFQYVDPENMEGTVVETWQGAIWSDNTERTINEGGWEKVLGATNFPEGYYTIKIHGHGASEGETLKWMITSSPNVAPWASGEIENGSQVAIFRAEDDSLSLYVSDSTDGDGAVYEACTVKQCGFTPTYYLNLRTGQLVANDVTARGAIYATEGEFNGKLSIGEDDKFIVDPATGELTMNGHTHAQDSQGYPINPNSAMIDLLKLYYDVDADSLARIAVLKLQSSLGSIVLDTLNGIVSRTGIGATLKTVELIPGEGIKASNANHSVTLDGNALTFEDFTNRRKIIFDGGRLLWYSKFNNEWYKTGGGTLDIQNGFLKVLED